MAFNKLKNGFQKKLDRILVKNSYYQSSTNGKENRIIILSFIFNKFDEIYIFVNKKNSILFDNPDYELGLSNFIERRGKLFIIVNDSSYFSSMSNCMFYNKILSYLHTIPDSAKIIMADRIFNKNLKKVFENATNDISHVIIGVGNNNFIKIEFDNPLIETNYAFKEEGVTTEILNEMKSCINRNLARAT